MSTWQEFADAVDNYFAETKGWDKNERIRFLSLAICGEAGELANFVKKDWRGTAVLDLRQHVRMEIADIAIYLHELARNLDTTIDACCEEKVIELKTRHEYDGIQA